MTHVGRVLIDDACTSTSARVTVGAPRAHHPVSLPISHHHRICKNDSLNWSVQITIPSGHAVDSQDIVTDAMEFKRFDLSTVKKEELEFHSDFTLKLSSGNGAWLVHQGGNLSDEIWIL